MTAEQLPLLQQLHNNRQLFSDYYLERFYARFAIIEEVTKYEYGEG